MSARRDPAATTLGPYVVRYVAERQRRGDLSALSARDVRWTLWRFAGTYGDRPLEMFGPKAIERWLDAIGHMAPATRREYGSRVRMFCRWMVANGHLRTNPADILPSVKQPRRVPKALGDGDVATLLDGLTSTRSRLIVWLMVGCGLRCIEVARLSVGDYDRASQTLSVRGKGGHERVLPVPATVRVVLDTYLNEVGAVAGPLIRSEANPAEGLSPKTISGYMRRWMLDAGVKARAGDGRSAHALRHTAASDVLDGGADIRVVQEMLGHSRLETTTIYLRRVNLGQLREAMEGRTYGTARGRREDPAKTPQPMTS